MSLQMISREVLDAIDLIWNNKFDAAELILISKSNKIPRYCLHYAESAFLRSFITANENDTEAAMKRLKETRELAENTIKILEANKTPPNFETITTKEQFKNHLLDSKIVLADASYMISVLQITRDHKFKGCLNLRKSWKIFEEALKQVKDDKNIHYDEGLLECLHFGAGFFFFAISIIPQKFLKIVEFVGFKADRDLGLNYIKECSQKGGIRAPFATMVILFNNLLLPRGLYNPVHQLKEAEELIVTNLQKYPNGSLFQVMASHCYRKQCKIDLGLECMLKAISNCQQLSRAPLIYKYELANCYCMLLNWDEAIKIFEELVAEESFQIRALCALQLASCYVQVGKKKEAMEMFSKIKIYSKKASSIDPIIQRQSMRYLNGSSDFSAFEIMYIRRDLAKMERGMAEKSLASLDEIAYRLSVGEKLNLTNSSSNSASNLFKSLLKKKDESQHEKNMEQLVNDRSAYLLIKGSILKGIDRIDEALHCLDEIVQMQNQITEKFYLPYCYYELSECYFQKKNSIKSLECIHKCNNYSNYDWEDPLKVRIRVTLDQLKKDGASGADLNTDDDDCLNASGEMQSALSHSSSNSDQSLVDNMENLTA
ncbi:hypothetical protein DLAC_05909 [Tieghemostelium lacteum]|uniref:Uncharacterized protein n=1 Tax=Tieghemostelium lacteum TaxID=361077 RepID=A0A151ZH70_TIELA|nr:hypothetical protein DLAC_05909 [Tieghemostelium lacteum]|eukprot:KYQ93255.1 hypothetical protein DLAC_05909 [Tieghemostelium lacteum]